MTNRILLFSDAIDHFFLVWNYVAIPSVNDLITLALIARREQLRTNKTFRITSSLSVMRKTKFIVSKADGVKYIRLPS